jgi:hypothetical protein
MVIVRVAVKLVVTCVKGIALDIDGNICYS